MTTCCVSYYESTNCENLVDIDWCCSLGCQDDILRGLGVHSAAITDQRDLEHGSISWGPYPGGEETDDDVHCAACEDLMWEGLQTIANRDALVEQATAMGYAHGVSSGSWVIDGNTSDETKAAWRKGLEDGDPEYLDRLPSSPLSGEWAGEPLPKDVLADLGLPADDIEDPTGQYDYLLDAYEEGFSRGAEDTVTAAVAE